MDLQAERLLAEKALAGDIDARNQIVMSMLPFVQKEAWKIAKKWRKDADDLAQVGIARVLQTFHKFDPQKGVRPITYFGISAQRAMWDFATKKDCLIAIPGKIVKEHLKEDAEHARNVDSLNYVPLGDDREIGEFVADPRCTAPVVDVIKSEKIEAVQAGLGKIQARLKEIIDLRTQGLTFTEIGKRFGVSKARIEQLEKKAYIALMKVIRTARHPVASTIAEVIMAPIASRVCPACDKEFTPVRPRATYCSRRCARLGQHGKKLDDQRYIARSGICVHCQRNYLIRSRGLCVTCYFKKEIRQKYPNHKRGPKPTIRIQEPGTMNKAPSKPSGDALIDLARRKLQALTDEAATLKSRLESIEAQRREWEDFIAKADALAAGSDLAKRVS